RHGSGWRSPSPARSSETRRRRKPRSCFAASRPTPRNVRKCNGFWRRCGIRDNRTNYLDQAIAAVVYHARVLPPFPRVFITLNRLLIPRSVVHTLLLLFVTAVCSDRGPLNGG